MVFGQQTLALDPGTTLEVSLDVRLIGAPGSVVLRHALEENGVTIFEFVLPEFSTGEGCRLSYAFHLADGANAFDCDLSVVSATGQGLALEIQNAVLTMDASPRGTRATGLVGELRVDTY